MISVTKIFTFDSAHNLINYEGACKNLHGHTYKLEVTVSGKLNDRGMICDFNELSFLIKDNIISKLDHKYLNDVLDFNPTCEMMVKWMWDECKKIFVDKAYAIKKIVLWETSTSFATIE